MPCCPVCLGETILEGLTQGLVTGETRLQLGANIERYPVDHAASAGMQETRYAGNWKDLCRRRMYEQSSCREVTHMATTSRHGLLR